MHSTSSWYLPHSTSLQSGQILQTFRSHHLHAFDRIWFFFANFATNSSMCRKRAYGATIWSQSVRFVANSFVGNISVVVFSCLIVNCNLSPAWFQVEKCQPRSNLARPTRGSKFQVLLHDFPSLRQQCQETCPFYCALREQRQFLKVEQLRPSGNQLCARKSVTLSTNIHCDLQPSSMFQKRLPHRTACLNQLLLLLATPWL